MLLQCEVNHCNLHLTMNYVIYTKITTHMFINAVIWGIPCHTLSPFTNIKCSEHDFHSIYRIRMSLNDTKKERKSMKNGIAFDNSISFDRVGMDRST